MRSITVIAGMGGGGIIHNPVQPAQMEDFGRITGKDITIWEYSVLMAMDTSYRNEKTAINNRKSGTGSGRKHQATGEYCNGKEVETCRKTFGEQLERVCATCPD